MVKSIGFAFDGSFLVGADDEGGGLEVVHVESGEGVGRVRGLVAGATCVAWHPGRYWVAWAGEGGVVVKAGEGGGRDVTEPPGLRVVGAGGGGG